MIAFEHTSKTATSGDPWLRLFLKTQTSFQLGSVAQADFEQARQDLAHQDCGYTRRNFVRCFGSLLDALTTIFRDVSEGLADALDRPRNGFLSEKSRARGTTSTFRVRATFRLVAGVTRQPAFTQLDLARWERLHSAVEVRNRILHPDATSSLAVPEAELRLIDTVAAEFIADLEELIRLCAEVLADLFRATNAHRSRIISKIRLCDRTAGRTETPIAVPHSSPLAA
jgi:hypothetical protein